MSVVQQTALTPFTLLEISLKTLARSRVTAARITNLIAVAGIFSIATSAVLAQGSTPAAPAAPAARTTTAAPAETATPAIPDMPLETAAPAPTLKIGDAAPKLVIEKWLKGDAITEFKPGQVYVVEFWATWCGPCIESMPHLSKLAKQYKDKGIHIIGVNIGEQYNEQTAERVQKFVNEQGERMQYHVAYDGSSEAMANAYMNAAQIQGIPACFLVDKEGKIAWIGRPMMLDLALDMFAKGTWDSEKGPAAMAAADKAFEKLFQSSTAEETLVDFAAFETEYPLIAANMADMKFGLLLENKKYSEAYTLANKLVDEAIVSKDVFKLAGIAWTIVAPGAKIEQRDFDLAVKAADKAVEFTQSKNADVLDTAARANFSKGNIARAIELQTAAVALAEGRMKTQLEQNLAEYQAANGKPTDAQAPNTKVPETKPDSPK